MSAVATEAAAAVPVRTGPSLSVVVVAHNEEAQL